MKVISLGCNCDVGYFIKKHFPSEYYPFDWLWSNIDFIIYTFETDYFEFTECDKLNAVWDPLQPYTYIFNNNCNGSTERKCSAISLHDANNQTPEEYSRNIPRINEKYRRRFSRLYNVLQNENENILFLRKVLYRSQGAVKMVPDTNSKLNYLSDLLRNKFQANIRICVIDDDNCIDKSERLNENIMVVHSFDEILHLVH